MKHFFDNLIVLVTFLLSTSLFYFAITLPLSSPLLNMLLFIVAIFVLIQGCGKLDKLFGLGEFFNENKNDEHNEQES
jgi:hypothetical protein